MSGKHRPVDALFGALAVLFGAVSLWFPLGRDQGLFYYAAREWLLRGQVLYRDVFDHKPPVIYVIHMLTLAVFGEHPWGIRFVELFVAVPLLAWLSARLASPRRSRIAPGTIGAAWLGISIFYYGYSGFWDTAQCEIWVAVLAAAALVLASHSRDAVRGAVFAGVLSGLGLFTKPTAGFFALVVLGAVLSRAWQDACGVRGALRTGLAWAAGGLAVGAVILGYFAIRHALGPMLDILIGANGVYVDQERGVHNSAEFRFQTEFYFATLEPFSTLFVVGVLGALFVGFAMRDVTRVKGYLLAGALFVASYAGVVAQLKFYGYHWETLAAASGVFAVAVYSDIAALGDRRAAWVAPVGFVAAIGFLFFMSGNARDSWWKTVENTASYATGKITRPEFMRGFDIPMFFAAHDAEVTGDWLKAHARSEDTLVVRGFDPEIYARSGLHYTGRFFWTAFLTLPTRAYKRPEWLAEDLAAIAEGKPRWAVGLTGASSGLDSPSWLRRLGYVERARLGSFTVLERRP